MADAREYPTWIEALGRIPSGLFIVTVRTVQGETGMLASWVQQCSFSPPQITVAVRQGRPVLDWLSVGAAFAVNVIPEGNKTLVAHFGKGFEPEQDAFQGIETSRGTESAPFLAAALACLDCRVASRYEVGDHVLIVGLVQDGLMNLDGKPAVHLRKSGLHY